MLIVMCLTSYLRFYHSAGEDVPLFLFAVFKYKECLIGGPGRK